MSRIVLLLTLFVLNATVALAAPIDGPERFVLFAVNETENEEGLLRTVHMKLVNRQQQEVGEMDLVVTLTQVPPEPEGPVRGVVTGVATLSGGQIVAQGAFTAGVESFELAVVGGTGDFRRVRGDVKVVPGVDDGPSKLVVRLRD